LTPKTNRAPIMHKDEEKNKELH